MPTPAQGASLSGLGTGLTSVKVKKTGADPTSSSNKLDASTLDLAAGSNRVYVDGLPDAGAGSVEGITTTITAMYLGQSTFTAGDTANVMGTACRVTDVETEHAVGELVKTTVTFVSIPAEE